MTPEQLRTNFKIFRQKANMNTATLEQQTKTGGGSVSNFEKGNTNVGIEKLLKWCEVLELELKLFKKKKVNKIQNHE